MKKYFVSTVFLTLSLFCFSILCHAQNQQSEITYATGYTNQNIDGYWGKKDKAHWATAIHLTDSMLNGTQIVAFKCAIGATDKVTDCKFFIRKELEKEENLYEQEFEPTYGWNYIPLDFAFNLSGLTDLYIGYELTTSGFCIGYEQSNQEQPEADYIQQNFGAWKHLSDHVQKAVCIVPVLAGGNYTDYPQHAIDLLNDVMPKTVKANTPFSLQGLLINQGTHTLKNFEAVYQIDKGEEQRQLIETNLWNKQNIPFELPLEIPEGKHQITIRLENPNGTASKDTFAHTYDVVGLKKAFKQTLLIEYFTGQGCGNCPDAKNILDRAMYESSDKIALITHHAGYAPDLFTIKESVTLAEHMDLNSAPLMSLNRSQTFINGQEQLAFHPAYIQSKLINSYVTDASPIGIDIANNYYEGDSVLQVKVSIENDITFDLEANLHVYLCENNYEAYQGSNDGGYSAYNHSHFPRKMLTAVEGDTLVYNENGYCERTYTYKIPAEYKAEYLEKEMTKANPKNMELTAFVATYKPEKQLFTVYNATTQPLKSVQGSTVTTAEKHNREEIALYIESGCVTLLEDCTSALVYSLTGSLITQLDKDETICLQKGIYLFKAITSTGTITRKINLY